ncbi:MAG TPA: hypothetical protein VK035_10110 [Kiloniellales bacterium]|nr:hypothetical protein [Kiloniellales bacterium]
MSDDVEAGRLVMLFTQRPAHAKGCHPVYPAGSLAPPAARLFRGWLPAKVSGEVQA